MPDRAPARPEEALEELRGWASDGKPVTEYGADTYPGLHAQPPPPPASTASAATSKASSPGTVSPRPRRSCCVAGGGARADRVPRTW